MVPTRGIYPRSKGLLEKDLSCRESCWPSPTKRRPSCRQPDDEQGADATLDGCHHPSEELPVVG